MNLTTFKYSRRPATVEEIESVGFSVSGSMARSEKTGACYHTSEFFVGNSATIEGVQRFGQFIYLEDSLPVADRVLVALPA